MNIAIIFAGGTGQRMNSVSVPKQFLIVHGKPIIIHTIEKFQNCNEVDSIVVVIIQEYLEKMRQLISEFRLTKVVSVVGGGTTGQESIYNGLCEAKIVSKTEKDIVLIHDGVRPLIDDETIRINIDCVKKNGSAITTAKATETVMINSNNCVSSIVDRNECVLGRAPQSFYLNDILKAHEQAKKEGRNDYIDSATLMMAKGFKIYVSDGPANNIKITTPMDFFVFKAILDAKENEQIKVL